MARTPKKSFFKEPTKAEIKKLGLISIYSNFIGCIKNLESGEGLIIERELIPEEFKDKFRKHGPEIKLGKLDRNPLQAKREALNHLDDIPYSCISYLPARGKDLKKRVMTPAEGIEATRIIYHSFHTYPKQSEKLCFIKVKPHDNTKRAGLDGIIATAIVPSRTMNVPPYKFRLMSIPVIDNENKSAIASSITSTHDCGSKRYFFGYNKLEDKEEFNVHYFCAHEIAAYWALIRYYGKRNLIPLKVSPFLFATQQAVDIYKKIISRVLIRDKTITDRDKLRKPNKDDINVLFFKAIREEGHDPLFYATKKIQNYNWAL